jgi:hypothetical protein
MTSPDFQTVKFSILGVSYLYTGSSGIVSIVSGKEQIPLKLEIEEALKRIITQHMPADQQLVDALTIAGYRLALPKITYLQMQPKDKLPEGAIS